MELSAVSVDSHTDLFLYVRYRKQMIPRAVSSPHVIFEALGSHEFFKNDLKRMIHVGFKDLLNFPLNPSFPG